MKTRKKPSPQAEGSQRNDEDVMQHTCISMSLPDDQPRDLFVPAIWGNRGKFWPNQKTLRVRFINGSSRQRTLAWERFRRVDEWCGLAFKQVMSGPSEIRVAFNAGSGHWSYVGTDNLSIPSHYQTMNLALSERHGPTEWDRVAVHEIFHAIGFNHEHQHPMEKIPWDREAVYRLYGRTQGWSRTQIDQQVLNPGSAAGFVGTGLDTKSLMMYPVDVSLVLDPKYASGWNTKPTQSDLNFLSQMYP